VTKTVVIHVAVVCAHSSEEVGNFKPRCWAFFEGCTPNLTEICEKLLKLKGSVKEPNMFHNYETEKIQ